MDDSASTSIILVLCPRNYSDASDYTTQLEAETLFWPFSLSRVIYLVLCPRNYSELFEKELVNFLFCVSLLQYYFFVIIQLL